MAIKQMPPRRGVVAILSGSAGGQAIGLLAIPLLSRLLPPGEYGLFAVANACILPLATCIALRLDLAVPRPDSEAESLSLAKLGLRASALLGLAGTLLMAVLHREMGPALGLNETAILVWVPLIASLIGAYTVLNQVAIRQKHYRAIGQRNFLQGTAVVAGQLAAGYLGFGAHGLAGGLAFGQLAGVLSLAYSLRHLPWIQSGLKWLELLKKYRIYPLILAPSGAVNTLGTQVPIILISALYGSLAGGWIGMTQRILTAPISLIGLAIAQVFLGEFGAAKRENSKDLHHLFMRSTHRLAAVSLALLLAFLVLSPWAFEALLGNPWRTSGEFARALAIGTASQMIAAPLSQTLIVLGNLKIQAAWDFGRLAVSAAAVLLPFYLGLPAIVAVWFLGAATAISYVTLWALSYLSLRSHLRKGLE